MTQRYMGIIRYENSASAAIASDLTKSGDARITGRAETALDVSWTGTIILYRNTPTTRAPAGGFASSDEFRAVLEKGS